VLLRLSESYSGSRSCFESALFYKLPFFTAFFAFLGFAAPFFGKAAAARECCHGVTSISGSLNPSEGIGFTVQG